MSALLFDRIKETTTTTGTGTITLAGAVANYRTFSSVLSVGQTCYYVIEDATNNAWECGIGTLASSSTLARTTVTASSNSNAAVSFGAGTKSVWIDLTAFAANNINSPSGADGDPPTSAKDITFVTGSGGNNTADGDGGDAGNFSIQFGAPGTGEQNGQPGALYFKDELGTTVAYVADDGTGQFTSVSANRMNVGLSAETATTKLTLNIGSGQTALSASLTKAASATVWALNNNGQDEKGYVTANVSADQNDYTPTGETRLNFLTPTGASRNLTGWVSGGLGHEGRRLTVVNASGSNNLVLKQESASSSADNRFNSSTGADVTLAPGEGAELIYGTVNSNRRWQIFKK